MLFQEFCSKDNCRKDIYGLFDLATKKMLIKPSDWPKGNSAQVQKLIGCDPSPLNDEDCKNYFMIFQAIY